MDKRQLFLSHVGQTSAIPMGLDLSHAKGMYIYDVHGKKYLDMNSGIAVSSLGHCHPQVVSAVQKQVATYMHTMVYGEHIQTPQVAFATLLSEHLDPSLDSVYFLMAGTEATETAMKLAKRVTGRANIVACRHSYHGSTQGAESLRSDEEYKNAFYPLLPGIIHIDYNSFEELEKIDSSCAAIIIEPVQGEAGVILPASGYLKAVRERCYETGTLLIFDEIQTGFGRTGHLFRHQAENVIPDVMLIGKAMGGGMPIAGVVANRDLMNAFTKNPMLGHITTFGGHPVSCAAAHAALKVLLEDQLTEQVHSKAEKLSHALAQHSIVKEVRHAGLMMAVEVQKRKYLKHIVSYCWQNGLIIDYFLFNNRSFRLAPPLIIDMQQIDEGIRILTNALDHAKSQY